MCANQPDRLAASQTFYENALNALVAFVQAAFSDPRITGGLTFSTINFVPIDFLFVGHTLSSLGPAGDANTNNTSKDRYPYPPIHRARVSTCLTSTSFPGLTPAGGARTLLTY